jgi:hypothetical protein
LNSVVSCNLASVIIHFSFRINERQFSARKIKRNLTARQVGSCIFLKRTLANARIFFIRARVGT